MNPITVVAIERTYVTLPWLHSTCSAIWNEQAFRFNKRNVRTSLLDHQQISIRREFFGLRNHSSHNFFSASKKFSSPIYS